MDLNNVSFAGYILIVLKNDLSVFIHTVVILLIISAGHIIGPFLIIQIPTYGFFNSFFKLQAWFPTQFFLQFVTMVGMSYVSWKARTKWLLLAFEAEYGLCGLYFVSS